MTTTQQLPAIDRTQLDPRDQVRLAMLEREWREADNLQAVEAVERELNS